MGMGNSPWPAFEVSAMILQMRGNTEHIAIISLIENGRDRKLSLLKMEGLGGDRTSYR